MEDPRPEKVAIVDEVRERLSSSGGVLLTEYRGLKVGELAELRRSLRQAGGDYKIYKNTLVRFAARDAGLEGLDELLVGPTALAFAERDAVDVARALRDFARGNPNLVVKGGLLGGKVLGADEARALADVPPREVLLARLAGGLAAPMQQFAGLLQALPRNLAYGLKALIDQGGAAGDTATAGNTETSGDTATTGDTGTAGGDAGEPETRPDEHPLTTPETRDPAEGGDDVVPPADDAS